MSTAFMVDNILNDKDDHTESISSDGTESDTASDIKDSICGSPRSNHESSIGNCIGDGGIDIGRSEPDGKINLSESLLRTYAMIRGGGHLGIEMCCAKCGHFQIGKRSPFTDHQTDTDCELDFKCDKCGGVDAINTKETLLKDSAKPILKFSVSAILGDRKECVKVRNGKKYNSYWFKEVYTCIDV